jgi:threonine dehydrogenase-like Zn-dependent dehydrogenase
MRAMVVNATWEPKPGLDARMVASRRATASLAWRSPVHQLVDVPDPMVQSGEILVEVARCGVCGSDTHCYEHDDAGYVKFSGPARFPVIGGHEWSGRVVEVGRSVRGVRVGEWVCGEGMVSCGVCEPCKRGDPNQCLHLDMVGFSAPGAFAERLAIHERFVWSLDAVAERHGDAALDLGALVEPLACAFNGIWVVAGGLRPGSHVVVFGCGPIGLGAVLLARAAGAASILAFDTVAERRSLALACGADAVFGALPVDMAAEAVFSMTRGWGGDLFVEAAGAAAATVPVVEACAAPRSTLVYLGRTGERVPVGLDRLVTGAARIVGARGHSGGGCFPNVLRMLAHGRLDPMPMVTARFSLGSAVAAVARSVSRTDGKILVTGP